jgi:hypothetical protein
MHWNRALRGLLLGPFAAAHESALGPLPPNAKVSACPHLVEGDIDAAVAVPIFCVANSLLDHLVGGGQQCFWDGDAECLGGLQVDG